MYQLLTGPVLMLSLAVCVIGLVARVVLYWKGLNWKLDRVAYGHRNSHAIRGALRSVLSWMIPFASTNWRQKPVMCLMTFILHLAIILIFFFLTAHVMLFEAILGFGWPTLPQGFADVLTLMAIAAGFLLVIRRLALPEVRILTGPVDWALLGLTLALFITGILARAQAGGYDFWVLAHVILGNATLLLMPFTKLSHAIMFFCSRVQLGIDYGIKRGGAKTDLQW